MRAALAASLLLLSSCGGDQCVRVAVDISAYTVPDELDALHFRLLDARGLFTERTYELSANEQPVLELCRGDRTSEELRLVVLGLSGGTVVGSAPEVTIDFGNSDDRVEVVLAP